MTGARPAREAPDWEVAVPAGAELGERPFWDAATGTLMLGGHPRRAGCTGTGPATAWTRCTSTAGVPVGAAAPRRGGGYVLAAADGFRLAGPDGTSHRRAAAAAARDGRRTSGSTTAPAIRPAGSGPGRWPRTGGPAAARCTGSTPAGRITLMLDGVTESNGLGWSPDGGTMYYIDSGRAAPADPRVRLRPGSRHARPRPATCCPSPAGPGIPDGLVVDADGCLWVAFWGGSAVRRYSPDGELLAELPVPVSQPSCPAFGGAGLADLYVTTAWEGMTPAQRAAEPLAGHLLRTRVEGVGRPARRSVRGIGETSGRDRARRHHQAFPDGTTAVRSLDLSIADGELMVLVGPSGCGKTTALRMVAGLEEVTEGTILIDGQPVNDTEPRDRDIAMVFQSYALYPHLTVRDNMAFSLKYRKTPKPEIRRRVAEAAQILELEELLGRKPRQLSGGQRQRVAMGRAIVRQPRAFLMDEPLSNLDAKLRVQMRAEIAKLQRSLGVTTIYVTHDQTEAMTLGSRVAVLRHGVLQQVAAPQELYAAAGQPVRGRVHRLARDEPGRGEAGARRRAAPR